MHPLWRSISVFRKTNFKVISENNPFSLTIQYGLRREKKHKSLDSCHFTPLQLWIYAMFVYSGQCATDFFWDIAFRIQPLKAHVCIRPQWQSVTYKWGTHDHENETMSACAQRSNNHTSNGKRQLLSHLTSPSSQVLTSQWPHPHPGPSLTLPYPSPSCSIPASEREGPG